MADPNLPATRNHVDSRLEWASKVLELEEKRVALEQERLQLQEKVADQNQESFGKVLDLERERLEQEKEYNLSEIRRASRFQWAMFAFVGTCVAFAVWLLAIADKERIEIVISLLKGISEIVAFVFGFAVKAMIDRFRSE